MLELDSDAPLGVSSVTKFHEHEFDLPVGSTLVLVTDGAVEVRGESVERGLERLRASSRPSRPRASVCEAVARGDVRGRPADDDVAVLAARVEPLADRLSTRWPADAETLAAMRPLLRRWLARWGAGDDEIYDITVAVQEASANAVEHAYAPGPRCSRSRRTCDGRRDHVRDPRPRAMARARAGRIAAAGWR